MFCVRPVGPEESIQETIFFTYQPERVRFDAHRSKTGFHKLVLLVVDKAEQLSLVMANFRRHVGHVMSTITRAAERGVGEKEFVSESERQKTLYLSQSLHLQMFDPLDGIKGTLTLTVFTQM